MSHSYAILESIFEYQIHNFYGKVDANRKVSIDR